MKTKNVTNEPKLITQLEAPATEVMVVEKLLTGISINSRLTEETSASVTPERCIPEKKKGKKFQLCVHQ